MAKSDDGDAQGHSRGHRARGPVGAPGVRVRDHGTAARRRFHRPRRGHRVRAPGARRAARLRRRGEGPVREGPAAQGVHAQRHTGASSSRSSGAPGASSQNASNSFTTNTNKERTDMAAKWYELVTGSLADKKAYRQYKARIAALPEPYLTAANAFERYLMYNGGITDGDTAMMITMLGDFADLWERAAADNTPVEAIVGDDPVEFAEAFAAAYSGKRWIDKERDRLTETIKNLERKGRPMTAGAAIQVARHREVVQGPAGAARRRLRGGDGQHLRPPRLERRRQDHARSHPVDPAEVRRRHRHGARPRRRHEGGCRARVDQPDRPVRGHRRGADRPGEPGAGREAPAPGEPGCDRRRTARTLLAHRGGRPQGRHLLGRHAAPARHRDEPHRRPAGDLPRRAHHRARPAGAHRGVADHPRTRPGRHDRAAHHPVPRRGRTAGRPHRDPPRGHDHPERHPRRTEEASPAHRGGVRREAALPRRRLPRPRRSEQRTGKES